MITAIAREETAQSAEKGMSSHATDLAVYAKSSSSACAVPIVNRSINKVVRALCMPYVCVYNMCVCVLCAYVGV